MAVKVEITKQFHDGALAKVSNEETSFNDAWEEMKSSGELVSFEFVDVDETTRTETLIFRDEDSLNKFAGLFTENNSNLKSLVTESIEFGYQD